MSKPGAKPLRCAIYTRVSTDHGLEQDFNSLHAQREAAEAYVKSQAHEGWRLIKERFDDGGFSGGSLDRPALQRLLASIRSGLIDIVVVYKVDRLTRSLADFAKLVELFDAAGVSFVSVTQSFNTTTSMGRLTLNMLLSFAQFEREVTGERIRDKIAASKRKGIWVGGIVPLGYEVHDRKLVIREDEAAIVRLIFERYLALGSLPALQRELRRARGRHPTTHPQLGQNDRRRCADQWPARLYPAQPGLHRRAQSQGRKLSRTARAAHHARAVRGGAGDAHIQPQRPPGAAGRLGGSAARPPVRRSRQPDDPEQRQEGSDALPLLCLVSARAGAPERGRIGSARVGPGDRGFGRPGPADRISGRCRSGRADPDQRPGRAHRPAPRQHRHPSGIGPAELRSCCPGPRLANAAPACDPPGGRERHRIRSRHQGGGPNGPAALDRARPPMAG